MSLKTRPFEFSRIRCADLAEGREVERLLFESGYDWPETMMKTAFGESRARADLLCYPCVITLHEDGTLSWGKHYMEIPDMSVVDLKHLRAVTSSTPDSGMPTIDEFKGAAAALDLADAYADAAGIPSLVQFGKSICELSAAGIHKELMERFVEQPDGSIKLGIIPARTTITDDLLDAMGLVAGRFGVDLADDDCYDMTLPVDSAERKDYPIYTGCVRYFPAALAGVAKHSKEGNDKHNPGEPMHHSRGKSSDHADCIQRHHFDLGDLLAWIERNQLEDHEDAIDQVLDEVNAMSWRVLALSQELHERFGRAPLAPGAKL